MAQATVQAEEVVTTFADALLTRPLGDAVTLAAAGGLGQLVVSQAQRARPHVAGGPEVCRMAAALACVEITNATHLVWAPMKLVVAHRVACGREVTLDVVIDLQNLIIGVPFAPHIPSLRRSVIVLSLPLHSVAHESRLR